MAGRRFPVVPGTLPGRARRRGPHRTRVLHRPDTGSRWRGNLPDWRRHDRLHSALRRPGVAPTGRRTRTVRYRLMANYDGSPFEAGIGPTGDDIVLFAACPPPEELGFEPATGHWRKQVRFADVQ